MGNLFVNGYAPSSAESQLEILAVIAMPGSHRSNDEANDLIGLIPIRFYEPHFGRHGGTATTG
jgi:hypothetical protein